MDLLTQFDRAKQLLLEFKPGYLILLAGKTAYVLALLLNATNVVRYNPPKEQHEEYVKINTEIPNELAELAYEINARVCYTSTDLVSLSLPLASNHVTLSKVFDGKHGPYDVNSAPCPTTIYGESKLNAEKLLLGKSLGRDSSVTIIIVYWRFLVVRLSVSYGLGGGFFQIMYDALKRGEALELFHDEYRSFCLGTEVASMIIELLLKDSLDLGKIWHVAGPIQAS